MTERGVPPPIFSVHTEVLGWSTRSSLLCMRSCLQAEGILCQATDAGLPPLIMDLVQTPFLFSGEFRLVVSSESVCSLQGFFGTLGQLEASLLDYAMFPPHIHKKKRMNQTFWGDFIAGDYGI